MRPVNRGAWPKNTDGTEIKYKGYPQAGSELIKRLGEFCSYCEMHLDASLAVEHVQPKKSPGATVAMADRELDWDNFLLACTNCNSTKGNTDVVIDYYYWPDRDNTFRAFKYSVGGIIELADVLMVDQKKKAKRTIELTGLDKKPLNNSEASDRRWLNRKEAWDIASRSKERLSRNYTEDFKEQIEDTAFANGFWSIWMTVFKDDPDMLRRLIKKFTGTCDQCFDEQNDYVPIARPNGQI